MPRTASCRCVSRKHGDHDVTDRSGRLPTEAEIAAINAQHLIETPLKPADLLFVFGTRQDVEARVAEAVKLWREGYFRWSIVSGGITPGSDRSECEIITEAMIARGIPAENILREDRAKNTGENVIFSLLSSTLRSGSKISAA